MTAPEIIVVLKEFIASGRPGQVLLNFAPGDRGQRGVVTVVEIHQRLPLTRGEPDQEILDAAVH
jgi:hypothetical protein